MCLHTLIRLYKYFNVSRVLYVPSKMWSFVWTHWRKSQIKLNQNIWRRGQQCRAAQAAYALRTLHLLHSVRDRCGHVGSLAEYLVFLPGISNSFKINKPLCLHGLRMRIGHTIQTTVPTRHLCLHFNSSLPFTVHQFNHPSGKPVKRPNLFASRNF